MPLFIPHFLLFLSLTLCSDSLLRIQVRECNCGYTFVEPKRTNFAITWEMLFQTWESTDSRQGPFPTARSAGD